MDRRWRLSHARQTRRDWAAAYRMDSRRRRSKSKRRGAPFQPPSRPRPSFPDRAVSPMRMTSGSCRRAWDAFLSDLPAAQFALGNECFVPLSTYSIGSSKVTTWTPSPLIARVKSAIRLSSYRCSSALRPRPARSTTFRDGSTKADPDLPGGLPKDRGSESSVQPGLFPTDVEAAAKDVTRKSPVTVASEGQPWCEGLGPSRSGLRIP